MKKKKSKNKYSIILKNDNENSFDYVIQTLREICGHNYYQATQCAHIVHENGKCMIFTDKKSITVPVFEELEYSGLTVELVQ